MALQTKSGPIREIHLFQTNPPKTDTLSHKVIQIETYQYLSGNYCCRTTVSTLDGHHNYY